jgi:tetratricopeptide (TPR) repeat protein
VLICFIALNPSAEGQDIWHNQVQVNPPLFDANPSSVPGAPIDRGRFDNHAAARNAIRDVDVAGMEIGIDELSVEPDLTAALEQGSTFPTMLTIAIGPPLQRTGPHAASVSVGELAVPGKAHKALEKALQAVRKRQRDEARAKVAVALTIWPRYSDALVLSALLYLDDKQTDSAIAAAEEAVRIDQTNGMAHVVLAAAYSSREQYDDALRALEWGLRFRPDAWQGYFERARAEMGKGKFVSALMDANRAGELAPTRISAIYFLKGSALLSLNRLSDAVVQFQAYLRTNPLGNAAANVRLMLERSRSTP